MQRQVWAEIVDGHFVRIYKNLKLAVAAGVCYALISRAVAVKDIRRQVWERAKHTCEHCGDTVPWGVFELHEFIWRGRGGEVSVANGRCLCRRCHQNDPVAGHGERRIKWTPVA